MSISTQVIPVFLTTIRENIEANAEEVAALDQAIGDGDHVANLLRGLDALEQQAAALAEMDWPWH